MNNQSQPEYPQASIVKLALRDLLILLEAGEVGKPPSKRRAVPSLTELAEAANISRQGMVYFSEEAKRVNLETLAIVLYELRRRGFEVEVGDLLREYPVGE